MTTNYPDLVGVPTVIGPAGWSLGQWMTLTLLGLASLASSTVRVVPQHQRVVISRLGRLSRVCGPGLVLSVPGMKSATTVSLRTVHLPLTVSP